MVVPGLWPLVRPSTWSTMRPFPYQDPRLSFGGRWRRESPGRCLDGATPQSITRTAALYDVITTRGVSHTGVTVRSGLGTLEVLSASGACCVRHVASRCAVLALVVAGCVDGLVPCSAATKCRTSDFALGAVVFFKQPENGIRPFSHGSVRSGCGSVFGGNEDLTHQAEGHPHVPPQTRHHHHRSAFVAGSSVSAVASRRCRLDASLGG